MARRIIYWFLVSSSLLMLTGCAVEQIEGGMRIRPDMAEIRGVKLGEFDTPNGKAALRQNSDGRYSIKLTDSMKVVDVGYYRSVEIAQSLRLGNEQVVLLKTSNNTCPRSYLMYVFSPGKDRLVDKLGDCRSAMNFRVTGKTLVAVEEEDGSSMLPRYWEYRNQVLIGPMARRVDRPVASELRYAAESGGSMQHQVEIDSSSQADRGGVVVQRRAKAVDANAGPRKVRVPGRNIGGAAVVKIGLD